MDKVKYHPGTVYPYQTGWCFTVVVDGQDYYYRNVTYDYAHDAKQAMREKVKELNEREWVEDFLNSSPEKETADLAIAESMNDEGAM